MIVRFLAILELYKQGIVDLTQNGNFADLYVRWLGEETVDDAEGRTPVLAGAVEEYEG